MKWPPEQPVIYGRDYGFTVKIPPPAGYPDAPEPDSFAMQPFAGDFTARRAVYIDRITRNPAPNNFKSPFYELVRIAGGGQPHEGIFLAACDFIDARKDCSDFVIHSLLRLLYQFPGAVSGQTLERVRQTVFGFKYWPDEPGVDSLCTWTENHQILFASAAYLAGQLFPGEQFTNSGQPGSEKTASSCPRILRWLDLRFRTGFSEWLSNVYYDEDLTALLSLVDFCADPVICRKAETIIHLLLFDMALNSFQGVFGSTHGRSYENSKKWAGNEGTADTMKLLFGTGVFSSVDNMSAPCFALSPRYRLPEVLGEIARDPAVLENRQRMGIRLSEAERWGLHFDNPDDGMVFLSLEAYFHQHTVNQTLRLFDRFNWWENGFFDMLKPYRSLIRLLRGLRLMPALVSLAERDICRNTREEVNIYTYRTPEYMLSTAVDYRGGYGGDQQHIWQATLGPDATCFTTHPARREGPTPDYWSGSGTLPRAAQWKNVMIAVYNIDTTPGLYLTNRLIFTHAWLPRDRFDEVIERGGWIFARKGQGYLALRSRQPYRWQDAPGEDQDREIIVEGKTNIWICELGRQPENGSFDTFIAQICAAPLRFDGLNVTYQSPTCGQLAFGWNGPFLREGQPVALHSFPRYANVYAQAPFPPERIEIRHGSHLLELDWESFSTGRQ